MKKQYSRKCKHDVMRGQLCKDCRIEQLENSLFETLSELSKTRKQLNAPTKFSIFKNKVEIALFRAKMTVFNLISRR